MSATSQRAEASGVHISRATVDARRRPRTVALWLLGCCALVFVMVVVGGITRLTESGLSITRWQPVEGILPPLSAAAWDQAFADYRQTDEYRQVNQGMSLADFQAIYWWEYIHRLLGRLIGFAFAVPLAILGLRGRVPRWAWPHLGGLLALGALQGAIGWWMVQSGLVDRTDVSHYRLAVHLGMAIVIFAYMLAIALRLLGDARPGGRAEPPACPVHLVGFSALLAVTVIWGALTAGANAGWLYPEFPLMGGRLLPVEMFAMEPAWLNFVENEAAIQWTHRVLATLTLLIGLVLAVRLWAGRGGPAAVRVGGVLGLALLAQYGLGIATLLSRIELPLAVLHQATAVLVVAATVGVWHVCTPGRQARPVAG